MRLLSPLRTFYPQLCHAAVPVSHGIFIPKGATNLKFVLLGLSFHTTLQLSLCGFDLECVKCAGHFVSLQALSMFFFSFISKQTFSLVVFHYRDWDYWLFFFFLNSPFLKKLVLRFTATALHVYLCNHWNVYGCMNEPNTTDRKEIWYFGDNLSGMIRDSMIFPLGNYF